MSEMWERIRAARHWAKLTQDQLAEACAVTRNAVSQWEAQDAAKRTQPGITRLRAIARATHAPVEWLMVDDSELPKNWNHLPDPPWRSAKAPSTPRRAVSLPKGGLISGNRQRIREPDAGHERKPNLRSTTALERIVKAAAEGRLTEADLELLAAIAERIATDDQ